MVGVEEGKKKGQQTRHSREKRASSRPMHRVCVLHLGLKRGIYDALPGSIIFRPGKPNPGMGLLPPPIRYAVPGHDTEKVPDTADEMGKVLGRDLPPCLGSNLDRSVYAP